MFFLAFKCHLIQEFHLKVYNNDLSLIFNEMLSMYSRMKVNLKTFRL
jgi:hypothetical protein